MNATEPAGTGTPSLDRNLLAAVRTHIGGRRGLLILGALAVTGGLAWSWNWLVAAGVAPLLLSVLPCIAMCALAVCMCRPARLTLPEFWPDRRRPGHGSEAIPVQPDDHRSSGQSNWIVGSGS